MKRIRLRSPQNLGRTYGLIVKGQEDNNVQLSANMLFISGNCNGGKRDDNAGCAEKGDSSTESTTTILKDEVSTSSVNESNGMTDTDRWGAAVQTDGL